MEPWKRNYSKAWQRLDAALDALLIVGPLRDEALRLIQQHHKQTLAILQHVAERDAKPAQDAKHRQARADKGFQRMIADLKRPPPEDGASSE